jgi:hypothetical protein
LENDNLESAIASKDAAITQLQQAAQSVSVSGNVFFLHEGLKKAKHAANLNADFAEKEQASLDAFLLQLEICRILWLMGRLTLYCA